RSPDLVDEYARTAESRGILSIICGAAGSGAGGLAGAVAARTALPVIGVPIASETLGGTDALYSAVQMPRGGPDRGVDGDVGGERRRQRGRLRGADRRRRRPRGAGAAARVQGIARRRNARVMPA